MHFVGRGLDRMPASRAHQRIYNGRVGSLNTISDIRQWIDLVKSDRKISDKRRQQRLRFMYAITFSSRFRRQWRGQLGDLEQARKALKRSYEQYMTG